MSALKSNLKKRVLVNGAFGKMGSITCETLQKYPEQFVLVGKTGRSDCLKTALKNTSPDLVIDFTIAGQGLKNTQIILEHSSAHPIIGTSGWTPTDLEFIQTTYQENNRGGLICPNFSISAALLMLCSKIIAPYFDHAEIIETHHPAKFDKPSQTSLALQAVLTHFKSIPPIHSVRMPGETAKQTVIFGKPGELFTLEQDTRDRAAFMPGVILACQTIQNYQTLLYGLSELLDLKKPKDA